MPSRAFTSAKTKLLAKKFGTTLGDRFKAQEDEFTAARVGDSMVAIDGQLYPGIIAGDAATVTNSGRPAAAQYTAGSGGVVVVSGGGGGSVSTGGVSGIVNPPGTLSSTSINADAGLQTHAIDMTIARTPATLTPLSVNENTTVGHTHLVDASSDPDLTQKFLKTNASGQVILRELRVRDSLGGSSGITYDGTGPLFQHGLRSASDDRTSYTGRAALGYVGHGNFAGFAHRDHANPGGYGFLQGANGYTFINAPAGGAVLHRINNSDVMAMDATRLMPAGSILKDLGDYNRKWRTLFAAELYVETLVAQSVLATIGGRIIVAPTVKLIADINASQTTIDVDYSSLLNGDYVYMATAPGGLAQIEAMKVVSGATAITGGYRYSVTRALDGTPANSWVAGDAIVSLGNAAGKGYIELTSTSTIHNHLGPNITIYSRTGTVNWNDVKPTVSMGNLRSFVDYSSDEVGFAVGNDLTLTPASGFKGSTNDRTNGLRMFNTSIKEYSGGTLFLTLDTSGLEFTGVDQSYARIRWLTSGDTAEIGAHLHGDNYKRMDLRSWSNANSAVRVGAWNTGQTNLPVAYVEVSQASYASKIALIAEGVGVGTASPGYKLDVADRMRVRTGGNGTGGIWLSNSAGDNRAFVGLLSDDSDPEAGVWVNGAWRIWSNSTGTAVTGNLSVDGNLGNWSTPTYGTNWADYGGAYGGIRYRKLGDMVMLQGLANTTGAGGAVVATLPLGYRPALNRVFAVSSGLGLVRLDINSDGSITTPGTSFSSSGLFLSLNGVVFYTT